jgi:hypothetical protein
MAADSGAWPPVALAGAASTAIVHLHLHLRMNELRRPSRVSGGTITSCRFDQFAAPGTDEIDQIVRGDDLEGVEEGRERMWPFLNRRSPLSARLFPRSYDPASALEVGPAVMFLTHLRPNCARSLQFAAGVWARAFKIAAEPS